MRTTASEARYKVPNAGSPGEDAFALHCRVEGLDPRREWPFCPTRKWRFDFFFQHDKLAVEIEGRGRHQSFGGFEADAEKYNTATLMGIRVLRYTPAMVIRGDAIDNVLKILGKEPR